MEGEVLNKVMKKCPFSIEEFEDLPVYAVLLIFGGYLGIGLGFFHFLVTMTVNYSVLLVYHLVVNLIFGFGLLVSFARLKNDMKRWSILAVLFSIVMIAVGGIVGSLAGLIGLTGGGLAFLTAVGEIDL